jgi:hypothetical protein
MLHKLISQLAHLPNVGRVLTLVALLAGVMFLGQPTPAQAHCDSVNGPVVQAAEKSLDTRNLKYVLAYVPAEAEAELNAVFTHTLSVRKLSPQARELADRYFFETAVRLHRAGEGAPFTGLNEETDHGPALEAADQALQSGALDEVHVVLNDALEAGLAEKYADVQTARSEAKRLGTVAADRERAEAELMFETYVFELYTLATGGTASAEGTTNSHQH